MGLIFSKLIDIFKLTEQVKTLQDLIIGSPTKSNHLSEFLKK